MTPQALPAQQLRLRSEDRKWAWLGDGASGLQDPPVHWPCAPSRDTARDKCPVRMEPLQALHAQQRPQSPALLGVSR